MPESGEAARAEGAAAPPRQAGRIGAAVVRSLLAYAKALRLYPPEHRRVTSAIAFIRTALTQELEPGASLEVALAGETVRCNGEPAVLDPASAASFAGELKKRRIRAIRLREGVTLGEIQKLGELLTCDHKRLLLAGGAEVAFPPSDRPHLDLEVFAIRDLLGSEEGEGTAGFRPDLLAVLREALGDDALRRRIAELQSRLREGIAGAEDGREIDVVGILLDRLVEIEREGLDARKASGIIARFLDHIDRQLREREAAGSGSIGRGEVAELLATALGAADPEDHLELQSKLERLKSFFVPEDEEGAAEAGSLPSGETDTSIFTRNLDLACMANVPAELMEQIERVSFDPRTLARDLADYDLDVETLGVAAELLVATRTQAAYREIRQGLVRCFQQAARRTDAFVRAALYLARETPPPPFEERAQLLAEILRQGVPRAAVVRFLEVQEDRPEELLRILECFVDHAPTLVLEGASRLLANPLLASLRSPMEALLLRALAQPGALKAWLEADPEGALEPHTFEVITRKATPAATALVKRIFTGGSAAIQDRLIRRLRLAPSDVSLEWILLGLRSPDRSLRIRLTEALSDFRQPEAVAHLEEILLAQNQAPVVDGDQIRAVLRSLARIGTPEARSALRAVALRRRLVRRHFRIEIRRALEAVLEQEGTP